MRQAVLAVVVGLAAASVAPALACQPARMGPPEVRVVIRAPDTTYRRDQDRASLTAIGRQEQVLSHHEQALGLTVSHFVSRIEIQSWMVQTAPGEICAGVAKVDAVLEIPDMTVFVAAEYPHGSCESYAVIRHENEHVTRTRSLLRPFGRRLKRALADAAARVTPVRSLDAEAAERHIHDALDGAMQAVMRELDAERRRVNAEIDTPEEYRRIISSCSNW